MQLSLSRIESNWVIRMFNLMELFLSCFDSIMEKNQNRVTSLTGKVN